MVQASNRDISSLFQTVNERAIAVLGEGFLSSFLGGMSIDKCFMILSDQRLYVKGKVMKDMHWTNYDTAINIEKLATTTITSMTNFTLIVLLALLTILTMGLPLIISICLFIIPPTRQWISGIISGYISPKMFRIEYEGGEIAVSARWYGRQELEAFRRALTEVYSTRLQ